jgi:hypothetical protein
MRPRLTYANVVATLALAVAVGTGGAWAASQINGGLLKDRSVKGRKLKKNTLTGKEIRENKLAKVPKAKLADTALNATAAANAGNASQLGGIAPGGFIQGAGKLSSGRTTGTGGSDPNVIRTFTTPIGEFRLSCGVANADVRYFNTTAGSADVFRASISGNSPGTADSRYEVDAQGDAAGFAATSDPAYVEIRAGKGGSVAILRVGEARSGADCIWNWELVTSG